MASVDQRSLKLAWGMQCEPMDAPIKVVRQIESDAQALAVAMMSGGHKCASVGAAIGKSEGYVSRMRTGKRPVPDKLIGPLCAATGSNLLRQYRALVQAIEGQDDIARLADLMRMSA